MIERERLESMTLDKLKKEARRYKLRPVEGRGEIIDQIMTHLERNSPMVDLLSKEKEQAATSATAQQETGSTEGESIIQNTLAQLMVALRAQLQNQQQMMGQFRETLQQFAQPRQANLQQGPDRNASGISDAGRTSEREMSSTGSEARASMNSRGGGQSTMNSLPPANAVSLLALQIPEFGGGEDENVVQWIQRVDKMAQIHRVPDNVALLAASSKLVKAAKKWYELQSGATLASWVELRGALQKIFERKVPFHVQMQKIEARRWNHSKETFQHYAIEKLALMHSLNLQDRDSINLLISGIAKTSLRDRATTVSADTVEQFMEHMRKITAAANETERKSVFIAKLNKSKDFTCINCGKKSYFRFSSFGYLIIDFIAVLIILEFVGTVLFL